LSAHSVCRLPPSPGGIIDTFREAAKEVQRDGDTIVISQGCNSSCVIFADLARKNVCITQTALLGVHKATMLRFDAQFSDDTGRWETKINILKRYDQPQSPDLDQAIRRELGGYPLNGVRLIPINVAKRFWRICPKSI
jgi:hypothetical protein